MTQASNHAIAVPKRFERFPPPLHRHPAIIDHHNARVKVFRVSAAVIEEPVAQDILRREFDENQELTKLMLYAVDGAAARWRKMGFSREGRIGRFFADGRDAVLWARYSEDERAVSATDEEEHTILKVALSKEPIDDPELPVGFTLRMASPDDAARISSLLQQSFSDYPDDTSTEVVRQGIMREQLVFALIERDNHIVSMASARIDRNWKTAEISDCVTVPHHRGRRLMVVVVDRLVNLLASSYRIRDFYSLARARQIGMNAALARTRFKHDGRLINNCRMPTGWETMNVWWRSVAGEV